MTLRRIGERPVFPIALAPVPAPPGDLVEPGDEMFDTVTWGLEAGVTLIDAGWLDSTTTEHVVAEAIASWQASAERKRRILVAGSVRLPEHPDGLDALDAVVSAAAQRLDGRLGLVLLHPAEGDRGWVDGRAAVSRLLQSGAAAGVGVAGVDPQVLDALMEAVGTGRDGIVAVGNALPGGLAGEAEVISRCAAAGLAYLPQVTVASQHAHEPASPFESVTTLAEERAASTSQLLLAWLLAQAEVVVPVVACAHAAEIEAAVHAADVHFDDAELARLSAAIPENLTRFGPPAVD